MKPNSNHRATAMKRVASKTALVTAAGKGIGRASALALAREGATVWATDVDEQALKELAAAAISEGLAGLKTARLDVLDTVAVKAFAERTGKPRAPGRASWLDSPKLFAVCNYQSGNRIPAGLMVVALRSQYEIRV